MPNRRYNTQVANPMKMGGRVKKEAVDPCRGVNLWNQGNTNF